ncbi:UNVERIFIED_CONTAM: hypothetical protein FKN15_052342 [Acipenser sinensis]
MAKKNKRNSKVALKTSPLTQNLVRRGYKYLTNSNGLPHWDTSEDIRQQCGVMIRALETRPEVMGSVPVAIKNYWRNIRRQNNEKDKWERRQLEARWRKSKRDKCQCRIQGVPHSSLSEMDKKTMANALQVLPVEVTMSTEESGEEDNPFNQGEQMAVKVCHLQIISGRSRGSPNLCDRSELRHPHSCAVCLSWKDVQPFLMRLRPEIAWGQMMLKNINICCMVIRCGGKDSCYNMMQCVAAGHQIVALANLRPAENEQDELDSYMYQTVGHQAIDLYAEAMDLPLYRRTIVGTSLDIGREYSECDGDEVEDLYHLLKLVKEKEGVEGVSVGAILSDYQRIRVENVCKRLNLQPLAYLWRRNQEDLLREMISSNIQAMIIKVAAFGLDPDKHLGKTLDQMEVYLKQVGIVI